MRRCVRCSPQMTRGLRRRRLYLLRRVRPQAGISGYGLRNLTGLCDRVGPREISSTSRVDQMK